MHSGYHQSSIADVSTQNKPDLNLANDRIETHIRWNDVIEIIECKRYTIDMNSIHFECVIISLEYEDIISGVASSLSV